MERSARLSALIRAEIQRCSGSIPFDRFMGLALYTPGLGYYAASSEQFGVDGDFVTAPEISPLLAVALATQCSGVLERLGGGDILELGAGTGRLAGDLLQALEQRGETPDHYYILEPSATLRARQQDHLRTHHARRADRVVWLEDWPTGLRGVAIANEVLDALPVRCFEITSGDILERRVGLEADDALGWHRTPADAEFRDQVTGIGQDLLRSLPPGYCSELSPHLKPWVRSLGEAVREGVAFLIDYGYPRGEYFHWQRNQGTLIYHYRHRAHFDPFFFPGLQDLSASVDFTAVAEAGEAAGMEVLGYASQAQFILTNALQEGLPASKDEAERLRLAHEIKRLTLPSEMGDRFQVVALGRGYATGLRRFALRDMRFRL